MNKTCDTCRSSYRILYLGQHWWYCRKKENLHLACDTCRYWKLSKSKDCKNE